jgi:hypothetical protein
LNPKGIVCDVVDGVEVLYIADNGNNALKVISLPQSTVSYIVDKETLVWQPLGLALYNKGKPNVF